VLFQFVLIELTPVLNTTYNSDKKRHTSSSNKKEQKGGSTLVLNPGSTHKKVDVNTQTKQYKLVDLP
jgi:hypothetical protein